MTHDDDARARDSATRRITLLEHKYALFHRALTQIRELLDSTPADESAYMQIARVLDLALPAAAAARAQRVEFLQHTACHRCLADLQLETASALMEHADGEQAFVCARCRDILLDEHWHELLRVSK